MVKYTAHKIYHLNKFLPHSLVGLTTFTVSYNLSQEYSPFAKREPYIISTERRLSIPSFQPSPRQLPFYLLSINLNTLGTSLKWNHRVFVFWGIGLFQLSIMSLSFIHAVAWARISFRLKRRVVEVHQILFTCSFISAYFRPLCLLAVVNNAAECGCAQASLSPCFQFFCLYAQKCNCCVTW